MKSLIDEFKVPHILYEQQLNRTIRKFFCFFNNLYSSILLQITLQDQIVLKFELCFLATLHVKNLNLHLIPCKLSRNSQKKKCNYQAACVALNATPKLYLLRVTTFNNISCNRKCNFNTKCIYIDSFKKSKSYSLNQQMHQTTTSILIHIQMNKPYERQAIWKHTILHPQFCRAFLRTFRYDKIYVHLLHSRLQHNLRAGQFAI